MKQKMSFGGVVFLSDPISLLAGVVIKLFVVLQSVFSVCVRIKVGSLIVL